MPYTSGLTQTPDQLEQFQDVMEFSEMGPNSMGSDKVDQTSQDEIQDNNKSQRIEKDSFDNKGTDFGFRGRQDFLISPESKVDLEPLTYFGYDYFINDSMTYASSKDVPIPSDYILGPGDEIKIILYGNNNKKYNLIVTREGEIFLPEIGPISVAGLTFSNLKESVEEIVKNEIIGTQVSLTLGNLRSISIFILGEANRPGLYTVNALSTLTNAIFLSGGIKKTGSLRNILLKRNGKIISILDLYGLLLNGDTSNDQRLMSGDVIFISPAEKQVGITGAIGRPGIYELQDTETAEDLIQFAGTLKPTADHGNIEIERIDSMRGGYNLINADSHNNSFSRLALNDGDTLRIGTIVAKLNNAILLSGHTPKQGFYPLKENMRLIDIVTSKEDLLTNTDMNYLLIKRESKNGADIEVIQINLNDLLNNQEEREELNVLLQERDELVFFPSLLSANLIETQLLEDDYSDTEDKQGISYLRQSSAELENDNKNITTPNPTNNNSELTSTSEQKYYEYSIHDYCILNNDQVTDLIESIDSESASEKNYNYELTSICRKQLLQPILELLENQKVKENIAYSATVLGNVIYPGQYPLPENPKLKNLIAAAGGLNNLSVTENIEVTRKIFSGSSIFEEVIEIDYALAENFEIKPLDTVTVKNYKLTQDTVTLTGEVVFPGTYPISSNETLDNLIKRAGGLTLDANFKNTFFSRRELALQQSENIKLAQQEFRKQALLVTSLDSDDSGGNMLNVIKDFEEFEPDLRTLGRVVFKSDETQELRNIQLRSNDFIIIPKQAAIVSVIGEVYSPNSHLYSQGLDFTNYVDLSGGFTKYADIAGAYIIKGSGSVVPIGTDAQGGFFKRSAFLLEAGDTIVVPLKISQNESLKIAADISQILYQVGLAAAAINSLN